MVYKEGTGELIDKLSVAIMKFDRLTRSPNKEENVDSLQKTNERIDDLSGELSQKLKGKDMRGDWLFAIMSLHLSNIQMFDVEDGNQTILKQENPDGTALIELEKWRLYLVNQRRGLINHLNKDIDGGFDNDVRIHKPI